MSTLVIEFVKSTQNTSMFLGIAFIFIILFMMTPLNSFSFATIVAKIIIIMLLLYILWYNTYQTNKFSFCDGII